MHHNMILWSQVLPYGISLSSGVPWVVITGIFVSVIAVVVVT